jgi:mannose PTS system EIIA component
MPGLLIIAHAPLASSLKAVAAHAFAEAAADLQAYDVAPQLPLEQIEREAAARLDLVRRPEALILADVFGATPFNVAQRLCDGPQVKVIAGVNVPMLWRALSYRDASLDVLIERALAGAVQGVILGTSSRPQNQTQVRRAHDPTQHHHQQ